MGVGLRGRAIDSAHPHGKLSRVNAEPEQTQTRDCVFQKQVKGVADTLQAIPNGCANSLPHCSKHRSCAPAATSVTAYPCKPRECTQAWQQARCRPLAHRQGAVKLPGGSGVQATETLVTAEPGPQGTSGDGAHKGKAAIELGLQRQHAHTCRLGPTSLKTVSRGRV